MSTATTIIRTLTYSRATKDKLETATNVLNELYKLRKENRLSFFVVRRAIKMQEKIVNELQKL